MMKSNRFLLAAIAMTLVMAACGSNSGGDGGNQPEVQVTPTKSEQVEVKGEPFISAPGVSNIPLLTEVTGAGAKPLFRWEAVAGASRYQLTVFDEAGEPYWAWEGTTTQIYIGGTDTRPPDDSSGPSTEVGYSWAVVAYGSDGKVLAVSEIRSISP